MYITYVIALMYEMIIAQGERQVANITQAKAECWDSHQKL